MTNDDKEKRLKVLNDVNNQYEAWCEEDIDPSIFICAALEYFIGILYSHAPSHQYADNILKEMRAQSIEFDEEEDEEEECCCCKGEKVIIVHSFNI